MSRELTRQNNSDPTPPADDVQARRVSRIALEGAVAAPTLGIAATYSPSPLRYVFVAGIVAVVADLAKNAYDYIQTDRSIIQAEREHNQS